MPADKVREIRYASHMDSAIYSIYARKLNRLYEIKLQERGLESVVLAYRSGIGYNVPFARALIQEIRDRGDCRVICLDLSKFFDSIGHKTLKAKLEEILGCTRLSADWHSVYSRLTKYEFVFREVLEAKLGDIKKSRICNVDTFRRVVRPLIEVNSTRSGIPQGTPLSGLFANVSMMDIDLALCDKVSFFGGSYRRYSDDIAIILPDTLGEAEIMTFAEDLLTANGLSFNSKKTCKTTFSRTSIGQTYDCDPLQYLGFTYDGSKILIRAESMKAFYAKMKTNISRYVRSGSKKGIPLDHLRKRVLVGRFTHWGDNKNFVQYAYKASDEMRAPEIRYQLRNHVKVFNRHWSKAAAKYY